MGKKLQKPFSDLYIFSFVFSIQFALIVYILSSFLGEMLGEKLVGIVIALGSALAILFVLEMPKSLKRIGNYRTAVLVIVLNVASLLWLGSATSKISVIMAFFLYTISNYTLFFSMDVFIESFSKAGSIGRTRGAFLSVINFAKVISPIIAGLVIANSSYSSIFILAAVIMIPIFFLIYPKFKNFEDPVYEKVAIKYTFSQIFGDINIRRIFQSEFLLRFFYVWMIVYIPIYLHQTIGFNWEEIGLIFTIMLVPFVLLDYPIGRYSDKIGEKKMLIIGFIIASVATFSIFFITSKSLFVWAFVLFMTRVGAATIEAMNEIYFFKKIKPSDSGLISFFRNAFPFLFIIAPIIATILLGFMDDIYLFPILGIILLIGGLWSTVKLEEVK